MSDSASMPAIAGLAVGAALVFTFAFIFNSTGDAQQGLGQRQLYTQIAIQRLKTTYYVGENISFTEQITGFESDCNGYPDVNIEATDHSHTIFTTYDRNLDIGNCGDPDGNVPHMINLEYQSQKFFTSPIVADKAGKYVLTATYAHGKAEKEFTVVDANASNIVTVIIPEGASSQSSPHNNFEPSTIKVVIGYNNTVRWINKDSGYGSVVAADDTDPSFFNATQDSNGNPTERSELAPNESFEFTFTKAGEYHYYSAPHPWMQGTVIVVYEGHN